MEAVEKLKAIRELTNIGLRFPALASTVQAGVQHIIGMKERQGSGFPYPAYTIDIEEFAYPEGSLINPDIPESVWIDTLRSKTGLDIRAILSKLPDELGIYDFRTVCKQGQEMEVVIVKVWVIPVKE